MVYILYRILYRRRFRRSPGVAPGAAGSVHQVQPVLDLLMIYLRTKPGIRRRRPHGRDISVREDKYKNHVMIGHDPHPHLHYYTRCGIKMLKEATHTTDVEPSSNMCLRCEKFEEKERAR